MMNEIGMRLPLAIARFIGSTGSKENFTLERILKFYTGLTPPKKLNYLHALETLTNYFLLEQVKME